MFQYLSVLLALVLQGCECRQVVQAPLLDIDSISPEEAIGLHKMSVAMLSALYSRQPSIQFDRDVALLTAGDITYDSAENRGMLLAAIVTETSSNRLMDLLEELAETGDIIVQLDAIYGLGRKGCIQEERARAAIERWAARPERVELERLHAEDSLEMLRDCS